MALTTYGTANKVTDRALQIQYTVEGSTIKVGLEERVHWEVHRLCTKTYRYVGMTYAAAKTCRDAMIEKYTRTQRVWTRQSASEYEHADVTNCQADIACVHDEGGMWHVEIQVSENDVEHVAGTKPSSLASLFTWITCDYDE